MLAVVAFVVALGFGIVAPAIPIYVRSFGVGGTAVGLAVSSFAFFRFVSAFGGGALVERFGERVVLTAGLVVVAVTTGAAGLVDHFPAFLALRSAGGVGSAMFTVAALSLLLRVAPPEHRGRSAATFQGGFILGGIAGPAGRAARRPLPPPAVPALRRLPAAGRRRRPRPAPHARHADRDPRHPAVRSPAAPGHRPAQPRLRRRAGGQLRRRLDAVRRPQLPGPALRHRGPGRTVAWAGAGLLVGSVAQAVGLLRSGRLVDGWGRRPSLVVGTALATGSVALLVGPPSTVVFLVSMAVFGLGASLLASAPAALVADVSPARGGGWSSVFQMASDLGGIVGPLAAGALTDAVDYQLAFGVTAAVLAAGLVAALALPRR